MLFRFLLQVSGKEQKIKMQRAVFVIVVVNTQLLQYVTVMFKKYNILILDPLRYEGEKNSWVFFFLEAQVVILMFWNLILISLSL